MKRIVAVLLCAALTVSLFIYMRTRRPPVEGVSKIIFENTTGGEDRISMTELRTYSVSFDCSEKLDMESLTWYLQRDKGMLDSSQFPNQYLGGKLEEWKVAFGEDLGKSIFRITDTRLENKKVTMTFCSDYTFFSTDSIYSWDGVRNYMMDYIGDFNLICKSGEKEIASAEVRVNPYDSYRTEKELSNQLKEAAEAINTRGGLYAQVFSMGSSSMGKDIPYMIFADSKKSVDDYKALTKKALEDPQAVIDMIKSEAVGYRIPILFSNVHPDELDGPDAIMEFVETFIQEDTASYNILSDFTEEGRIEMEREMESKKIKWSSLIKDFVTGLGSITLHNMSPEGYDISALHTDYASGTVNLNKYYTIESREYKLKDILDKVFFILVPTENPDGREMNTRCNGKGFDLNRDTLYQTQPETRAMAKLIAQWNPAAFVELHGYNNSFQVEPCTPPHSSNVEVDLMMEYGLKLGEAFGNAAVANNSSYNSFSLCMRDYLVYDYAEEGYSWDMYCWDEQAPHYTPQYSQLHGTIAFTVEIPYSGDEGVKALKYGMLGYSQCVAENSREIYLNQLNCWLRGVNNKDEESVHKYYVDKYDNQGAEEDVFRPQNNINRNYFPEYYVIPMDSTSQRNLSEAAAIQQYLMDNGIRVSTLKEDTRVGDRVYTAGSIVINMYQAKRNVANAILSQGSLITSWYGLYGSAIANLPDSRGFDCYAVYTENSFEGKLQQLQEPKEVKGSFAGEEGYGVIIENDSLDAVQAVNSLLNSGCQVGLVTKGQYKGSFIIGYKDYKAICNKYVIKATGVSKIEEARLMERPSIYVAGKSEGESQGLSAYGNLMNTERCYDIYALQEQMGFNITESLEEATVIAGSQVLTNVELEKAKGGMPYIAYGSKAVGTGDETDTGYEKNAIMALLKENGLTGENNWIYDSLFKVRYSANSLITAVYESEKDYLMYGYGGSYFTALPEGAAAIIYNTDQNPVEGFFPKEALKGFIGYGRNVQAFTYSSDGYNLTVFANSLTSRAHQTDDYRLLSNAIYMSSLSSSYFSVSSSN